MDRTRSADGDHRHQVGEGFTPRQHRSTQKVLTHTEDVADRLFCCKPLYNNACGTYEPIW